MATNDDFKISDYIYHNNARVGAPTKTRMNCGNSFYEIYSWEGKTPKENYETYLIKIYSRKLDECVSDYVQKSNQKERIEAEIETLKKKRNTLKKQDRMRELEYQLSFHHNTQNIESLTYYLESERNVNRAVSEGKVWSDEKKELVSKVV
jgi:hypothetical protein